MSIEKELVVYDIANRSGDSRYMNIIFMETVPIITDPNVIKLLKDKGKEPPLKYNHIIDFFFETSTEGGQIPYVKGSKYKFFLNDNGSLSLECINPSKDNAMEIHNPTKHLLVNALAPYTPDADAVYLSADIRELDDNFKNQEKKFQNSFTGKLEKALQGSPVQAPNISVPIIILYVKLGKLPYSIGTKWTLNVKNDGSLGMESG
jgi:hypothetical protein